MVKKNHNYHKVNLFLAKKGSEGTKEPILASLNLEDTALTSVKGKEKVVPSSLSTKITEEGRNCSKSQISGTIG
ncbi:hypothetical protein RCL_jg23893.t1 [Rhizophagus clarus]|uniref:Uncharacterized protein n=1 Tax=Rhizophagus clarus TaxID=94130 RepID=A0A8H3QUW4_9GLOM|nr:hypothetical protein RCL_jg23893.t1 [Rhizophagus clarus]